MEAHPGQLVMKEDDLAGASAEHCCSHPVPEIGFSHARAALGGPWVCVCAALHSVAMQPWKGWGCFQDSEVS